MKNIVIALIGIIGIVGVSKAQCSVNAIATPNTITCGESVVLSAFGSSTGQMILDEDFDSGFGPGWSGTPGAVDFTNPCSPGGVNGTPHAWMGNNTSVPRELTSTNYDLSAATAGVTICFDMLFSTQGDPAPCEGPDEPDEGVYLQYSIDGGATWIDIHYFDPNGGYDPQLTSWNNYCFSVPAGGITSNTMFQWYQEADSGADYDHWGIDNVQIFMNDINSELVWLHDGYSYGVGNPGGDNPTPVTPTSTTTYTAQITTGTGAVCTQDVTVTVLPPTYNVNVAPLAATICDGDCAAIAGSAEIIADPGGVETYENNEFELVASGSASVNINVQGINTNAIYNGLIDNVTINGFDFSGSFLCTNFGGCDCNGTQIAFGSNCDLDASGFTVTLTDPCGNTIILAPAGVANGNYSGTVFVPVGGSAFGPGFPSTAGPWDPQDPMSTFNGCDPNGVWTLSFDAPGLGLGIGTLFGWSITFNDPPILQPVCTTWSPTTGLSNPTSINTDACPTTSTSYTLTIENCVPGCPTYTEQIDITVDPCSGCTPPNINIINLQACSPNTVDLSGAIGPGSDPANVTYHNTQADAQNDVNPIGTTVGVSGSYWIRAEDPADPTCFLVYEVIVTINDLSYSASIMDENCGAGDGQISLTPNLGVGPYTYSIDGGTSSQGTGTFTGLSAGSYDIVITDNSTGCSVTGLESVSSTGGPSVDDMVVTAPSCPGVCDGTITATVSGGNPPYTYQWYDAAMNPIGLNAATITGLCAGDYSLEVTDVAGVGGTFWMEDFGTNAGCSNQNQLATAAALANGSWTQTILAAEGGQANLWFVSATEAGMGAGNCGDGCLGNAALDNQTLHVGSIGVGLCPAGDCGAAYNAGGTGETHKRIESPTINCTGQTNITLDFNYMHFGEAGADEASLLYWDGGAWNPIAAPLPQTPCCGGPCTGLFVQGQWTPYSILLPASANNNPNVRLAFVWDNDANNSGADPSFAVDDITLTTAGGGTPCPAYGNASIVDPAANDPSFTLTDFCAGTANGATNIATPGGTFAYNPNPGDGSTIDPATGEITNGVNGTTYTVEYTTPGACPVTATNTVTVTSISYSAVITDENCGAGDGAITLTALGGSGSYTYSIDGGTSSQGTPTFNNLSAGNYSIEVIDVTSGCVATGIEIVGNIGGPSINVITPVDPSCAGVCDGTIDVTVSGGTPPYDYQWYDAVGTPIGTNSSSIANLCAGDYSVEISDATGGGGSVLNTNGGFETTTGGNCGCATGYSCSNDAGQVIDGVQPVWTAGSQGCVGGTTNYTNPIGAYAGAGYVYFYAGADNISSGPYTFVGGEQVELCVWYSGPPAPGPPGQNTASSHFSFGVDGVQVGPDVLVPDNTGWTQYCFTVTMTAGNHTFEILSGGAAQYSMWFDEWSITDISGGGGTGCPVTANLTLTDPVADDPSFTLTDFCIGDANNATNIVTAGGTFVYNPDPADGSSVDPTTGEISNGVPGTTYTVEYTTGGTCPVSTTNTVTVNGFTYSAVIIDENCGAADGSIDLTINGGNGPFDYSVDGGITSQGTGLFSNLAAANYSVLITDQTTGCTASGSEIVNNIGGPTINSIAATDPSCLGICDGSFVAIVSGGTAPYDYQWYDGSGNPIGTNSNTITDLCDGDYTLEVSDVNANCVATSNAVLNPGPNCCDVVIDTVYTLSPNCGISNGEIEVQATGGNGVYQFNINGGAFSANGLYTGLAGGSFELIAIDGNGCSDTITVDLINATGPTISSVTLVDPSCNGFNDGEIQVIAVGGTGTLDYELILGVTIDNNGTGSFTGLGGDAYTVAVTDQNGCQVTAPAVLTEPDALVLDTNVLDEVCFGQCNGSVTWSGQGGTAPYQFTFNSMIVSGNTVMDLCPGNYSYELADVNNCQVTGQVEILAAEELVIDNVDVVNNGCDDNCVGSISISSANAVSYNLGGTVNTTGVFNNLCTDAYSITVSDANGCSVQVVESIMAGTPVQAGFFYSPQDVTMFDPEIYVGELSSGETQYYWEIIGDDGYFETYDVGQFNHTLPSELGTYEICLFVWNDSGCADTMCQYIVVDEGILIWVPNSFTPDGDEFNQTWQAHITGIDDFDFSLLVYNRWGEVIWETRDPDFPWDGTYNGKKVQSGTYTWVMSIKDDETEYRENRTGHVNVLR